MITLCDRCWEPLEAGAHGLYACPLRPQPRSSTAMHTDESYIGGVVLENGFRHPLRVYSRQEHELALAGAGLKRKERFSPTPGTDIDPAGIVNPAGYIDAQTLENAAALVSRVSGGREGAGEIPVRLFNTAGTQKEAIDAQQSSR